MTKKLHFLLCIIQVIFIFFIYEGRTVETITYFPKNNTIHIEDASTNMTIKNEELYVYIQSRSTEQIRLRQDVALVYSNMYVKAILNKWKENNDIIEMNRIIHSVPHRLFEVLSYHHGEIVENEDFTTTSKMTRYASYFNGNSLQNVSKDIREKHEKEYMDTMNDVLQDLQIETTLYHIFPLIDLAKYEQKPLPNMNQAQTDKIIGHLWEGLYKNYIIPLSQYSNIENSLMPLILISKDNSHMLIVYTLNGKNKLLRQQL